MVQLNAFRYVLLNLLTFIVLIRDGSLVKANSDGQSASRPKPTNFFGKGGFKTYGKTTLATYLAKEMKPSVRYRDWYGDNNKTKYCFNCISINGNNSECEGFKGVAGKYLSSVKYCLTSASRPYCSTEYGLLKDGGRYVRRSCNDVLCESCTEEIECYTIQCNLCNAKRCNRWAYTKTFDDYWTGCRPKTGPNGTFACDAGGREDAYMSLLVIMAIFSLSFKVY